MMNRLVMRTDLAKCQACQSQSRSSRAPLDAASKPLRTSPQVQMGAFQNAGSIMTERHQTPKPSKVGYLWKIKHRHQYIIFSNSVASIDCPRLFWKSQSHGTSLLGYLKSHLFLRSRISRFFPTIIKRGSAEG